MRGLPYSPVAACFCLALATSAAGAEPPGNFDALKASAEITEDLARLDLDAASQAAAKLMEPSAAAKLKDALHFVTALGKSQYSDLVYVRDYGRMEKDIIYKIDYDQAFVFVRFLYHVDGGRWRLIHINVKTENDLPFPKDWEHIYPK